MFGIYSAAKPFHHPLTRRLRSLQLSTSRRMTSTRSNIKYMTGDELAELMKSDKAPCKDFVIVDVRDDDYAGGNIKEAINVPSREFMMNVDGLVKKTKEVPLVIFHCALSQVRGPKAARIYEETRRNILSDSDIEHEVVVLKDGFTGFQVKYKDDPKLIENWDKNVWDSEWAS